ncbi:MAG: leucine-rich repeat protein, partial [Bacillota bacterium]|nr:leucine-rich repeat protein [Bacillota bacterium]
MKKLLSIFLTLILIIFQIGTVKVFADTTSEDYLYSVSNSTAVITSYRGSGGDVTIPSNIDGYTVTGIGNYAFHSRASLTSITIPSSVTSIDTGAFGMCTNLKNIIIPNSVTSIADFTFSECTSLTSITIPNSVTSIGSEAFEICTNLKSITIPNSVTSIGSNVFDHCDNLSNITIPNSVTNIGMCAFRSCTGLTSIIIPNSVTNIDYGAFSGCTSLTSITIPNSVTSIGYSQFDRCTNLKSIIIGDSVKSIDAFAFMNCPFNTKIYYHDKVTNFINLERGYITVPYNVVSYNGNGNTGGTAPADGNIYTNGTNATILGNTGNLVKTGYTFAGWNTAADGSGTSYPPDTIVPMNGSDLTLYAEWTALPKCTVTFDSNGGSTVSPISDIIEGTTVTLPPAPTKPGYIFAGWNIAKDGSKVSFTEATPVNTNMTVYAKWIVDPCVTAIKGDFNADNVIDNKDLAILRNVLLSSHKDIKYDINGDNKVNANDYLRLIKMIINQPVTDDTNITSAFIDDNFRNAVYALINKSSSSPILYSDVKNIQNLNIASLGIKDLNGLEYFTSLNSLYCNNNQLTCLNVSKNTSLTTIDCSYNKISGLDLSKNTALTYLDCNNNQLLALDVSKNANLIYLNSSSNKLTDVNVGLNKILTYLDCSTNNISDLDVTKNTALT